MPQIVEFYIFHLFWGEQIIGDSVFRGCNRNSLIKTICNIEDFLSFILGTHATVSSIILLQLNIIVNFILYFGFYSLDHKYDCW